MNDVPRPGSTDHTAEVAVQMVVGVLQELLHIGMTINLPNNQCYDWAHHCHKIAGDSRTGVSGASI